MDHDCPEPQIAVTRWQTQGYSATAVMDVCGERRVYRDFGGESSVAWQDVTRTAE